MPVPLIDQTYACGGCFTRLPCTCLGRSCVNRQGNNRKKDFNDDSPPVAETPADDSSPSTSARSSTSSPSVKRRSSWNKGRISFTNSLRTLVSSNLVSCGSSTAVLPAFFFGCRARSVVFGRACRVFFFFAQACRSVKRPWGQVKILAPLVRWASRSGATTEEVGRRKKVERGPTFNVRDS